MTTSECSEIPLENTNLFYKDPTFKHYICIYPQYLNSRRTKEQGRRTSKENSIDNPMAQEIRDVCQAYGFDARLEPKKRYPRDPDSDPNHIGRVCIKLKNEDGTPCNPEFDTKQKIVNLCGEMIPKLTSRQAKSGGTAPTAGGGLLANQTSDKISVGKEKGGKRKGGKKR